MEGKETHDRANAELPRVINEITSAAEGLQDVPLSP